MNQSRVFTEAERKELGMLTRDLVDKAIDEGDPEKAKQLNHRMYAECLRMHDLYRDWVTSLLSYIYERHGIDELYEASKLSTTASYKHIYDSVKEAADFRKKVEMFAMGLRGHHQPLEIEEDDEKICLIMRPCGSGERLIQEGCYEPPRNFSKVKEEHVMTCGQSDFPVYCTHCRLLQIMQMEWDKYPLFVIEVPQGVKKEGCRYCFYKDREKVPEKYYSVVGKKKPI